MTGPNVTLSAADSIACFNVLVMPASARALAEWSLIDEYELIVPPGLASPWRGEREYGGDGGIARQHLAAGPAGVDSAGRGRGLTEQLDIG